MTWQAVAAGLLAYAVFFTFGAFAVWQWAQSFPDLVLGAI